MAKKKAPKTFLEKLSEKAGHMKEDLLAGKDHLVEVAGDAIASVKHSIEDFRAKKTSVKKAAPVKKKVAPKAKTVKKAAATKPNADKKAAKKAVKKAVPSKKATPKKKTTRKK